MKIGSEVQALAMLDSKTSSARQKEEAIHYLVDHFSTPGIEHLVQALDDDAFSVRWAAADALTYAGETALKPLLRMLISKSGSAGLREAACHALKDSTSRAVREQAQTVIQALKGPAADIAASEAAFELLRKL